MGQAQRATQIARLMETTREIINGTPLTHVAHVLESWSPRTLDEYLAGAHMKPHTPSYKAWLQGAESLTDPHARTFVELVLGGLADLAEPKRFAAAVALLRELSAQHVSAAGESPEWLQQLLALASE